MLVLLLRRGLPESPRGLAETGRLTEAHATLDAFAAGSGTVAAPIEPETRAPEAPTPSGDRPTANLTQLRSAPYKRRLIMLAVFHTFGYYGFGTLAALVLVSRGYDITSSTLFVALSFLGYPIGSALAIPLLARFERKYLLISTILALVVFGIGFATFSVDWAIVACGFLTTLTSNIFSNTYHVYQAEIFPTTVRATAVGRTYSLSRLSSAALPFVLIPVLHRYGAGAMFTVVALAMSIVVAVVLTMGPKTSRRSLEAINPA